MKNNKKLDLTEQVTMQLAIAELAEIQEALKLQLNKRLNCDITPMRLYKEVKRIKEDKNSTIADLQLLAAMSVFIRVDRQLQMFAIKALASGMLKDIVKEAKNGTDSNKKETPSA